MRKRRSNQSSTSDARTNISKMGKILLDTSLSAATSIAVAVAQRGVALTPAERKHIRRFRHWAEIGDTKAVRVPILLANHPVAKITEVRVDGVRVRPATAGRCYRRDRRDVRAVYFPAAQQEAA